MKGLENWVMPVQAVHLVKGVDWDEVAKWCMGEHDWFPGGEDDDGNEHVIAYILGCADRAYLGQWIVKSLDGRTRVHSDREFLLMYAPTSPPRTVDYVFYLSDSSTGKD